MLIWAKTKPGFLALHIRFLPFKKSYIKKKLNLWLTAPKGATPVN